MNRVRVKICGITNLADGLLAAELGADAVGFVFHRPSPRYIAPARAREIARALPAMVSKVGVFAGASAVDAAAIGESAGMDCLQLHARPDGDRPAAWSGRLLPVFSPSAGVDGA